MSQINFNTSPYYDDYDEDKEFYRILFRPEMAVQARELTQTQTILQKQVERFGNHIFKNGAMVIPGQSTYNNTVQYVKILTQYSGSDVDYESMIGFPITGVTSGVSGKVVDAVGEEANNEGGTDPVTLIVSYDGSGSTFDVFQAGEDVTVATDIGNISATVMTGDDVTGNSSMSFIKEGIYFIDGYFIIVDDQQIILDKYSDEPTYRIGLLKSETIITDTDDNSLTDNARGAPNYAAPGAHRLKIVLTLSKLSLTSTADENFIELHRVENGVLISETRRTEYAELEKTLARRTYDESGDYTVDPWIVTVQEHYKDDSDPILQPQYADGKYTTANGGDRSKLILNIDPGKGYVKGFEIKTISQVSIETNKARTTDIQFNENLFTEHGNYVLVVDDGSHDVVGLPDLDAGTANFDAVNLYDDTGGAGGIGAIIGTANVKFIYKYDANKWRVGLFNIVMEKGKYFSNVLSLDSQAGTFIADTYQEDSKTLLYESDKNTLIFPTNRPFVKGMVNSKLRYTVMEHYTATPSGGTVSLPATATGELYSPNTSLIIASPAAGSAPIESGLVGSISGGGSQMTISGFSADVSMDIYVPIIKNKRAKTKTFENNFDPATPDTYTDTGDAIGLTVSSSAIVDVFEIVKIEDVGASDADITDRYIFDSGQRDNYYGQSTVKRKRGAVPPVGNIRVKFRYFDHQGSGDYFSANSYIIDEASGFGYEDIPTYKNVRLSDALDFRPINTGSGFSTDTTEIPVINDYLGISYEYYLGRIDLLTISSTGNFQIINGEPSEFPRPPKLPENAMAIYEINMYPYTVNKSSCDTNFIENKRYTMRDIGRLEDRIQKLEYYSTLNMLEKNTSDLQIIDSNGYDRFKNGFVVDPFTSHGVGDIFKSDYRCAIDPNLGIMRPKFRTEALDLEFNNDCETNSSNFKKSKSLILLDYTESAFIDQPYASRIENVNPHNVAVFRGEILFTPSSDNWYETKKVGELIVNNDAHYKALEFMANNAEGLDGLTWNDWKTNWTSTKTTTNQSVENSEWKKTATDLSRKHTGRDRNNNVIFNSTESGLGWVNFQRETTTTTTQRTTTTKGQSRTGDIITHKPKTVNRDMGDRTVGMNYIPYMREKTIIGLATGMKPNTRVYPFFDEEDVVDSVQPLSELHYGSIVTQTGTSVWTNLIKNQEIYGVTSGITATVRNVDLTNEIIYISDSDLGFTDGEQLKTVDGDIWVATLVSSSAEVTKTFGDNLVTDSKGHLAFAFHIEGGVWKTGERTFILNDQPINVQPNQTQAKGVFRSQGSMLHQEGTVLSTKTIEFSKRNVSSNRVIKSTSLKINKESKIDSKWIDPVAQTILIEEEGGCFITAFDIYFQNKDESLPVTLQLREVDNGYPSTAIIPGAEVSIEPNLITISDDASEKTTFVFDDPVYVQQNTEYAFVLISDSFEYNIWISHLGDERIDDPNSTISSQPYLGVMFKSQNSSTWNATQEEDIKFTAYKAVFSLNEGTVYFQNSDISSADLLQNPMKTDPDNDIDSGYETDSSIVRIFHNRHGMAEGGVVELNDQSLTSISGSHETMDLSVLAGQRYQIFNVEFNSYCIDVANPLDSGTATNPITATTGQILTGGWVNATRDIMMDTACIDVENLTFPDTSLNFQGIFANSKSVGDYEDNQEPYTYADNEFFYYDNNENISFNSPKAIFSVPNEEKYLVGSNFPKNKSMAVQATLLTTNRNVSPIIDTDRMQIIGVNNMVDDFDIYTYTWTGTPTAPVLDDSANTIELTTDGYNHGLRNGNFIRLSNIDDSGLTAASALDSGFEDWRINDTHEIIGVDAGTSLTKFKIFAPITGTATLTAGNIVDGTVQIPISRGYIYYPEEESNGGGFAAKYITRRVALKDASIAFSILFAGIVLSEGEVDIFYRTLPQYEKEISLDSIDYRKVIDTGGLPDSSSGDIITYPSVPKSTDDEDLRDYEITVESNEPFVEIAVKLVLRSTNTSHPPQIKDFRVIALGT